jgi:hypothetical protein
MDNCGNLGGSLGAWTGKQLHHGRFSPYFDRARNCGDPD